jgi:hypothetical protein
MEEIFRPITFTGDRYSVSNFGRIRNNKSSHIFFPTHSGDLYRRFTFRRKKYRCHRLVAQAFIPNPLNLTQVRHIDSSVEGKLNNHVENLKWSAAQENALCRKNVIIETQNGFQPVIWIRKTKVTLKTCATFSLAEQECIRFKQLFCNYI